MHCILHLWNRRVFCGKIDRRGAAASFQIKTVVGTRPHYIMAQTSYYLPLFTRFASRTIGIHGIRTASDGLFPNGKLADLYKGFCLWHSQSWCLQMKVAKMKTTICICFCLCVLAGRDLIEITSCMRHDWGLFSDPSWPSPQMHILIGNCRCIDRFCISFSEDH